MKKIFALSKTDKDVILSQNIHGTPAIEQEKGINPIGKKKGAKEINQQLIEQEKANMHMEI